MEEIEIDPAILQAERDEVSQAVTNLFEHGIKVKVSDLRKGNVFAANIELLDHAPHESGDRQVMIMVVSRVNETSIEACDPNEIACNNWNTNETRTFYEIDKSKEVVILTPNNC